MSKNNTGKYQPRLIYTSLLKAISQVREYGIKKYGSSEDWRTTDSARHFDAAIRHIRAHLDGEAFDQESGLPHLSHAASNIMFELERTLFVESVKINLPIESAQPIDDFQREETEKDMAQKKSFFGNSMLNSGRRQEKK